MANNYDKTDLAWSRRGDLVLDNMNDIFTTEKDPLRSIVQEIRKRIKYELGELKVAPKIGANLKDYVGKPNNKTIAEAIKARLIYAICKGGLVVKSDLKVQYAPINRETLMVRIGLKVAPTSENKGSEMLTMSVVYNFSENHAYFV